MHATDLETLLQSIFRPPQPNAARVKEVLAQCNNAAEAWELLATHELLPPALFSSANRRFALPLRNPHAKNHPVHPCREKDCPHCSETLTIEHAREAPSSVLACATIAVDPEGILLAEELARECCARSTEQHLPVPNKFVWKIADRSFLHPNETLQLFSASSQLPWNSWTNQTPDPYHATFEQLQRLQISDLLCDTALVAIAGGLSCKGTSNPLEPWTALWTRGYGLLALHEETAVLGAALIDPPERPIREVPIETIAWIPRNRVGTPVFSSSWFCFRCWHCVDHDDGNIEQNLLRVHQSIEREAGLGYWDRLDEKLWFSSFVDRLLSWSNSSLRPQAETFVQSLQNKLGPELLAYSFGGSWERIIPKLTNWNTSFGSIAALVGREHVVIVCINQDD